MSEQNGPTGRGDEPDTKGSEADGDEPLESPPEGAPCAVHPDKGAILVCPRCRKPVCIGCWHNTIRRCHACLRADPSAAAPQVPWEDATRGPVARWLGTMATAFSPTASAPTLTHGAREPSLTFWLATFVPLSLLSWIVPLTHTVLFGPSFRVGPLGTPAPDATTIALDVARAAVLGALLGLAELAALAAPYLSLSRAFADRGHPHAPVRVLGYRAFLIPLSAVLRSVLAWGLPPDLAPGTLELLQFLTVVPLVLLFISLQSGARMGSGVGPLAALPTALVPFLLMVIVQAFLLTGLASWFPSPTVEPVPATAPAASP